jgi:hypothetical protein
MERMNNAITDPAINPTMNDLETGRFHAWEKREASRSGGVAGRRIACCEHSTKHQALARRGG